MWLFLGVKLSSLLKLDSDASLPVFSPSFLTSGSFTSLHTLSLIFLSFFFSGLPDKSSLHLLSTISDSVGDSWLFIIVKVIWLIVWTEQRMS